MTMRFIPGGTFLTNDFTIGQDRITQTTTSLIGFWIDQTEVTFEMYDMCVQSGACTPEGVSELQTIMKTESFASPFSYPVIQVDWFQAQNYCQWVGGDLPTEHQWEFAAGSRPENTLATFLWEGQDLTGEQLCDFAHYNECDSDNARKNLAPIFVSSKTEGSTKQGVFDLSLIHI